MTPMPVGEPDRPALAPLLRTARLRAGLSLPALARQAGLSVSTLKNLERGRTASLATLRALLAVRVKGRLIRSRPGRPN